MRIEKYIKDDTVRFKLSMTRGDSESFIVSKNKKDPNDENKYINIPLELGDVVRFTVRESLYSDEVLIYKEIDEFLDGKAIIYINPIDTEFLNFKEYIYDVEYTNFKGEVKTIIKPSILNITGEVTRYGRD